MTCSYDYLTEDWNHKSYVLYAFILNYALPMVIVIFFYSQIVKAVISHETALKAQAKKMNVESLRSNTVSHNFIFRNDLRNNLIPYLTTAIKFKMAGLSMIID